MSWAGSYRATPTVTKSASNSSTTVVVTKAAGVASGDLILLPVCFSINATGDVVSCPGFTAGTQAHDTNVVMGYQLLYRVADGTEGSTFTVTKSDGGAGIAVGQIVLVNSTLDTSSQTTDGAASSSSAALPSVTVAGSGELLLWVAGGLNDSTFNGLAPSVPGTISLQVSTSVGAHVIPDMTIGDNQSVASGATGTLSGSFSHSSYWSGGQIAVISVAAAKAGLLMMT